MSRGGRGFPKAQSSGAATGAGLPSLNYDISQTLNQNRPGGYLPDMNIPLVDSSRSSFHSGGGMVTVTQAGFMPSNPVFAPPQLAPAGSRRSSSSQSVQNISEPTSENSDDDSPVPSRSSKKAPGSNQRRREAHTQAEQKRRDNIKQGYIELEKELPNYPETVGNQKPSKAVVLTRSIDYIVNLEDAKRKQEEELNTLQKDCTGLQIMKQNYEKMAVAMRNQPNQGTVPVSDEEKFQVFQSIMENLFQSFDNRINTNSFAELSSTACNWVEEWCTPQTIRSIASNVLNDLKKHNNALNKK